MRTNIPRRTLQFTHEGAPSSPVPPLQRLKRLTMACMLWEDTFYIDGKSITDQIVEICNEIPGDKISQIALECFEKGLLRHIPLFLVLQALKKGAKCKNVIEKICNRPDQMTELLSLYWKDGKKPIPAQMKKGLALAFRKFDEYQLSKYNRDAPVKLRDVLFLCHAKPIYEDQPALWKRLISNELKTADTWETRLSAGEDKKESFQQLLENGKMGKLAIIRNLRNMFNTQIDKALVERELMKNTRPLLPFQFIAAAKECPQWEDLIDKAMIQSLQEKNKIKGLTILLVDISGSMIAAISGKSKMSCMDAACALAILLKEVCEDILIFSFSDECKNIPPRSGMALRDAILASQHPSGTYLGRALLFVIANIMRPIERYIVITDEQTHDVPRGINAKHGYILNLGCYKNGIFNAGCWHTITGFSENCIDYIIEYEKDEQIT